MWTFDWKGFVNNSNKIKFFIKTIKFNLISQDMVSKNIQKNKNKK